MLITDDRLGKALVKIAQSDAEVAELHANCERKEFKAKAIKDAIFLRSEGSVGERSAIAGTSAEYAAAMEDYFTALAIHEKLRNERQREFVVIEVWRSLSSARTKGIVS